MSDANNPATLRHQLQLSKELMAQLLHVSPQILQRWENSREAPNREADALLTKLQHVAELANKVYILEGVEAFLFTPLPEFKEQTAYNLMAQGEFEPVLGALAADYQGMGY